MDNETRQSVRNTLSWIHIGVQVALILAVSMGVTGRYAKTEVEMMEVLREVVAYVGVILAVNAIYYSAMKLLSPRPSRSH